MIQMIKKKTTTLSLKEIHSIVHLTSYFRAQMLMCVFSLFSRFLWIYSLSIPIFSLTSEDQCLSSDQTLLVKDIHTLDILTVSSDQSTISLPQTLLSQLKTD